MFKFLGDKVGAGRGYDAVVTARTRYRGARFMGCGNILYVKRHPHKLKRAVYMSYVRLAILHGNEGWCLKESEMGILRKTKKDSW